MSKLSDKIRQRAEASSERELNRFTGKALSWCWAIDWRHNDVELDEAREFAKDIEQMFLVLLGAIDYFDVKLSIARNESFQHTQVSLTQKSKGKAKNPTVVNIRAENGEDAIALAARFLEDFGDQDWYKMSAG